MERRNLYQEITDKVLNELNNGVIPWAKPWRGGLAVSHTTGGAYTFLNQMLISFTTSAPVVCGEYLTFKQVKKEGGRVRKGEHAATIMFYCRDYSTKETDEDGTETTVIHEYDRPILKAYHVFEVSQCEGIERRHTVAAGDGAADIPSNDRAEAAAAAYLSGAGVPLEFKSGDVAGYSLAADKIVLPERSQFSDAARYYSTLFHEMTHSTGSEKRLKRDLTGIFGSKKYAREELVAEMGAAYLSAILGTADDNSLKASASYIESWSKALTEDNALVVYAASRAQRAAEYIMSYSESK